MLVGLSEREQQLVVNSIIGQKLSVREVEAMVKGMKALPSEPKKKPASKSFDFSNVKERFDSLGFSVQTSSNKLTISFEKEEDIEKFLHLLS